MSHNLLCVGGPLDGQKYASLSVTFWTVVRTGIPPISSVTSPTECTKTKGVRYVIDKVFADGRYFEIWIPEGQRPGETMEMLLSGYSGARRQEEWKWLRKVVRSLTRP